MPTETEEWLKATAQTLLRWTIRLAVWPSLGVVVAFFVWQHMNARAIRQLKAQIVAAGDPDSPTDLASSLAEVPAAQNAALALMELWEPSDPNYWQAFREGRSALSKQPPKDPPPGVPVLGKSLPESLAYQLPWPESNRLAAVMYLAKHEDYLARLKGALERPACRFPLKWEDAFVMQLPHLQEIRRDAQLIALSALRDVEDGDLDAAIGKIRLIVRLGDSLQAEMLSASQLARTSIYLIAINCLPAVCSSSTATKSTVDDCLAILSGLLLPDDLLQRTLKTERAMALAMMDYDSAMLAQYLKNADGEVSGSDRRELSVGLALMRLTGIPKADQRFLLESYRDAIELSAEPNPGRVSSLSKFGESLIPEITKFPHKLLSALLLPPFGKLATRYANFEATRRAMRLALEVESFRLANDGNLKSDLNAMVSDELRKINADPFSGEPMRFRPLERGYVIYSVGHDLEDNGGELAKKRAIALNIDVGVRITHRPLGP